MPGGLLIHNPKAGSLDVDLVPKLVSALGGVASVGIEELGEAGNALHYAEANRFDWIAVAGGDGTVESVAATLVGSALPLGIIPAGTFNNFARSLDLPIDPIEACQVILAGNARPTDVGLANGKPFFECLGSGMDAALYPLGEEIKSGRVHRLVDFLRRAYRYRRQRFVLTLDRPVCDALARVSNNESHRLVHFLRRNRKIQSHPLGLDDHRLQRPLFRDELCRRTGSADGRRAFHCFGFQPLQQDPTLVAFCLHRFWSARILSKIHRLSCRKSAGRRPAKTARPPRRLTPE